MITPRTTPSSWSMSSKRICYCLCSPVWHRTYSSFSWRRSTPLGTLLVLEILYYKTYYLDSMYSRLESLTQQPSSLFSSSLRGLTPESVSKGISPCRQPFNLIRSRGSPDNGDNSISWAPDTGLGTVRRRLGLGGVGSSGARFLHLLWRVPGRLSGPRRLGIASYSHSLFLRRQLLHSGLFESHRILRARLRRSDRVQYWLVYR